MPFVVNCLVTAESVRLALVADLRKVVRRIISQKSTEADRKGWRVVERFTRCPPREEFCQSV